MRVPSLVVMVWPDRPVEAGFDFSGPTIDLALDVTEMALELPRGAGLALFTLGRSAGWLAHALEQYATGELIRPRATFVGPMPEAGH